MPRPRTDHIQMKFLLRPATGAWLRKVSRERRVTMSTLVDQLIEVFGPVMLKRMTAPPTREEKDRAA